MEQKIIDILNNILEVSITKSDYNTELNSFSKWDSLVHLRIISEIEGELDIEIGFDEINKIEKISDFLKFI